MFELLYTVANRTLPNRHQKTVGLRELRVVQAIKPIVNLNLERAVPLARLSHAFSEYLETGLTHASRSPRSSAHCSSHKLAEYVPCSPEA